MRPILSRGEPVQLRRNLSLRWGARGIKTGHSVINVLLLALALGLAAVMPQITVAQSGLVAYQTQYGHGNVAVVDLGTNEVCAYIPTGAGAVDVQVSPDGSRLYVVNNADGTVSVINRTTRSVETTVPIGRDPWSLAFSPDGLYAYVTNGGGVSPRVSVIRLSDNTVIDTLRVANYPQEIILTTDGALAYIGHYGGATAVEVWNTDTTTTMITSVPVTGREPSHIALTSDGKYLYASNNQTFDWNGSRYLGKVSVIDTDSHTEVASVIMNDIEPFGVGAMQPNHLTFTPDGKELWVSAYGFLWASVIDTDSLSATYNREVARVDTIATPITSWNVKFSPDGAYAYFSTNGALVIVNVESRLEDRRIPTIGAGWRTDGLAIATTSGLSCGAPVITNPDTDGDGMTDDVDPDDDNDTVLDDVELACGTDPLDADSFPVGSITGAVTLGGTGLAGVTVKLLGADQQDIGVEPATTDASGTYSFAGARAGGYVVMIIEPLGTSTTNFVPVDVNCGTAVDVPFVLSSNVVVNEARSKGYWKHQFDVATGGKGHQHETTGDLEAWIVEVKSRYTDPYFQALVDEETDGADDLADWHALLSVKGKADMARKAEAQVGALALNIMSLKVSQFEVVTDDGKTAGDVLTYSSELLTDTLASNDELAKDLAERVNTQDLLIDAGLVTPSQGIAYKTEQQIPEQFGLEQNYPNPFNPATTLTVLLPETADVRLVVYDLLGRTVAVLLEGSHEAGRHSVTFEAGSFPSGVYIYRLQAGEFESTKRMTLLR